MIAQFRNPLLHAAVLLLAAVGGCAHRMPAPSATLTRAAENASGKDATARTLSFAGFHSLLIGQNLREADFRFAAARQKDPNEPYAIYGALLLARRNGHPEQALSLGLELCERAPKHPLASAGARIALDFSGVSSVSDEEILRRGNAALAHGLTGDAALLIRSAVAAIAQSRQQDTAIAKVLADVGAPTRWSVLGPVSAFSVLAFDEVTPPERTGLLPNPFKSPVGDIGIRTLDFRGGKLSLSGESNRGDGYLLAVDADVAEGGAFSVRTVSNSAHRLYVDGTALFERRSFEHPAPTVTVGGVVLNPGRHRILIKLFRDDRAGELSMAVARSDGHPSQIRFSPSLGEAPQWGGVAFAELSNTFPAAEDLQQALVGEAGETLSSFIGARDGLGRDREGAKQLLSGLPKDVDGSAVHGLWAELYLQDRTIPARVGRGRATREMDVALEKDPKDIFLLLERATLSLDDGRFLEAADGIKQARAQSSQPGYLLPLLQSRVELGLGIEAQADARAQEALQLLPGLCEALQLRYDLARKRDAVTSEDSLLAAMSGCPGQLARLVDHERLRGKTALALKAQELLVLQDPTQLGQGLSLAQSYSTQRDTAHALAVLDSLAASWPRAAAIPKRRAEVLELAGRKQDALAAREHALLLDGSDLTLRRTVHRAQTGKELLAEFAIPAQAALKSYQASPGAEDATSSFALDAAAVRVYPDGAQVDRVHVIQKALDQSGVSEIGEVTLPQGAQLLALRTIKADGTSLEPESIEGKETISLPGVQVGDFVEYEFLLAHPSRGPAIPGFTAGSFYFQIARQPNSWSTYTVAAPKGMGLAVDAHGMKVQPPQAKGNDDVFFHEERQIPPFIPEPDAPPNPNEYLPFVTVGAGATGQEGLVQSAADASIDRALVTFEVEQFARRAVGNKQGKAAVEALYSAVMHRIPGKDAGLSQTAAATLAQDRGSRLMLLKASLDALKIPSRIAAVRTFLADPAPYRFPNESLLSYVCLRALADGQEIWLDTAVRFGPFGVLPEQAMGERDAYLFPEPRLSIEKVRTPSGSGQLGKRVSLNLALTADGALSGSGEEVYRGMDAAQLSEALDAMSPDQRSQALQQALSRYFGGADLSEVKVESTKEVGADLKMQYRFTAPRFARADGKKLFLQPLTFPLQLGRRFVQLSQRKAPLFIDGTEETQTFVNLKLPAGFQVNDTVPESKSQGPSGDFIRRERVDKNSLIVEESFRLQMSRIPPKQYEAFAKFAGEVDLLQTKDLVLEQR